MAAQQKKGKVTRFEGGKTFEYEGKIFNKFVVAFDNGDIGEYISVNANDASFPVGQERPYTIEEKLGKDGVSKHYRIKNVSSPYSGKGGGYSRPSTNYKAEVVLVAMKAAAQTVGIRTDLTDADFRKYLKAYVSAGLAEMETVLKSNEQQTA